MAKTEKKQESFLITGLMRDAQVPFLFLVVESEVLTKKEVSTRLKEIARDAKSAYDKHKTVVETFISDAQKIYTFTTVEKELYAVITILNLGEISEEEKKYIIDTVVTSGSYSVVAEDDEEEEDQSWQKPSADFAPKK